MAKKEKVQFEITMSITFIYSAFKATRSHHVFKSTLVYIIIGFFVEKLTLSLSFDHEFSLYFSSNLFYINSMILWNFIVFLDIIKIYRVSLTTVLNLSNLSIGKCIQFKFCFTCCIRNYISFRSPRRRGHDLKLKLTMKNFQEVFEIT